MKKVDILRYFCQYGVKILPVVNRQKRMIAVLTKDDIVATTAFVKSLHLSGTKVMENLLIRTDSNKDYRILQKLLENFNTVEKIPVINNLGKLVDFWNKLELLCAWEGLYDEYLFSIFSQTFCPVFIMNKNNRIIYANKEAKKILPKSKKDLEKILEFRQKPEFNKKLKFKEDTFLSIILPVFKKDNNREIYLNIYFCQTDGG